MRSVLPLSRQDVHCVGIFACVEVAARLERIAAEYLGVARIGLARALSYVGAVFAPFAVRHYYVRTILEVHHLVYTLLIIPTSHVTPKCYSVTAQSASLSSLMK